MFEKRRRQLGEKLRESGMQAAVICSPSNLYYFTGFTGGEAFFAMLLNGSGEKHGSTGPAGYVITDSRYYEQVEKECPGITLIRLGNKGYAEAVKELLSGMEKGGNAAIEGDMDISQYLKLCEACDGFKFQVKDDGIKSLRMVKDESELGKISKAEQIGDAAFSYIIEKIKPGMTEEEISFELEFYMKRHGAAKLSFDTIVASGVNSSMPHAKATGRQIENGDFITMDFGCVYQGYCSDMTRTVAVGKPTEEMKKVYQIVLDAGKRAMEQIEEGKKCSYIDSLARDYIKEKGYGDYFGHGLGHSVGLDVHEEPRFSPKCGTGLKENMVITVEPGIYLPGRFGVRIEDLVAVTKNGFNNLAHSGKELIIL